MEKEICECKRDYKSPLSGICEMCWDEKYPDKETLEEAAEFWDAKQTILEFGKSYSSTDRPFAKAFIEGAEWQAERMYSEEDMIATFHYGHQVGMNTILAIQSQHSPQPIPKPDLDVLKKEWFEQFKKK